jgi:hypothetical protein
VNLLQFIFDTPLGLERRAFGVRGGVATVRLRTLGVLRLKFVVSIGVLIATVVVGLISIYYTYNFRQLYYPISNTTHCMFVQF